MKKFLSIIALMLVLAMGVTMFASCGLLGGENPTEAPSGETPDDGGEDDGKITITWWLGSEKLKEEEIDKGGKATAWTPEKENSEFVGWFAETSCANAFDFEQALNEDTNIFAKFKTNEYVEDTTEYYLIGGGVGSLAAANWNHEAAYNNLLLVKDSTITDKNVYTITIDMYAGDRFQICHDLAWTGQQGIGIVVGAEYCDGINPNNNQEYTAADQKVAQVKNEAGEVVFIGGDENNNSFVNWNVICNEGHDGTYKFTLTTYPGQETFNTLTWELVSAIEPLEETHKMHLVGTFNNWQPEDDTADYKMNKSQDGKTWSAFLTVAEGETAEFKVVNQIGTVWHGNSEGGNFVISEAGTYAIQYTVDGNGIAIQKLDYYLAGTFVGADGTVVNFAVKDGVTPKLENGSVVVDFADVSGLNDFNWLAAQGKGVAAFKVVYGCELGIKDWYGDGEDNYYIAEAGIYTVTFADGAVTVTAGGTLPTPTPAGPQVGVAYKGETVIKTPDKTLYLNGETGSSAWYLANTETKADGVDLYLEAVEGVEGGYRLYFMNGEAKTYIRVYERTDGDAGKGKGSLELVTAAPTEYFTYDAELNTLIYTPDADNSYYLGSYIGSQGTAFDTLSVSNTAYITGDNAAKIGISQFILTLVEA